MPKEKDKKEPKKEKKNKSKISRGAHIFDNYFKRLDLFGESINFTINGED